MTVCHVDHCSHHVLVKVEFAAFNIGFHAINDAIHALVNRSIPAAMGSDIEPNLHVPASQVASLHRIGDRCVLMYEHHKCFCDPFHIFMSEDLPSHADARCTGIKR